MMYRTLLVLLVCVGFLCFIDCVKLFFKLNINDFKVEVKGMNTHM